VRVLNDAGLGYAILTERGTPEFYREEAARLAALAALTSDHAAKLELLEIAAVFLRLAERVDSIAMAAKKSA
jgi:hypothetical protein